MAHTFALRGERPVILIPIEHNNIHQRFIVSFQKHFNTIDICLFTLPLLPTILLPTVLLAPEGAFYGCYIRSWPCCDDGISEENEENYLFTLLNDTLRRGRWLCLR